MKAEQTDCSETLAYKIQVPGNYPEENIQHSEHAESLKSRIDITYSHHSCCTHQSTFVQTWHPQPCPNGCSPQRYSSSNVVETLPFQIRHNKTAALLLEIGHPSYLLGAL